MKDLDIGVAQLPVAIWTLKGSSIRLLLVIAAILALFVAPRVQAQMPDKSPTAPQAPQMAEIPVDLAQKIYRSQQLSSTCWAACNSMLLAAEGIESKEADQIQRMKSYMPDGGLHGAGAHFLNASRALGGVYGDRVVKVWYLDRRMPPVDPSMNKKFVSLIQQGKPVMVATPQHGMVAIAVKFFILSDGQYLLSDIQVNDPNPLVNGRRWLTKNELSDLFGFMAIETPAIRPPTDDSKSSPEKMAEETKLVGKWEGSLTRLGLTVVFRIENKSGHYTVSTDSPVQKVFDIKSHIWVTGNKVKIDVESPVPSSFAGILKENTLTGVFSQGGGAWPLTLDLQTP